MKMRSWQKVFLEKFFLYLKERLIKDFLFNEKDLESEYASWIGKKGESNQSKSDFYWSSLNLAIMHFAKNSNSLEEMYQKQREIYLLMFEFLIKEKKNVTHIQKQLNRIDILKAEFQKFELDVVVIPGNRCEYSKQFEGVKVPIETALTNFPIDYDKCDRKGGCVCCVGFEGRRNSEGRLIKKN